MNNKKITLPIQIIIISFCIGLIISGIGLVKQFNAKKVNEERRQAALKKSQDAINSANKRLEEIKKEYDDLKNQYNLKSEECDAITINDENWMAKKSKCSKEQTELQNKIFDLETENASIKSKDYTGYYQRVKPMTYQIFYIIGASVFGLGLIGAFIIYLVKGKKTY